MKSLRQSVYKFVENKFGVQPENLWLKFPQYAVFRNPDNNKWFGIIMNVPKNRLGLEGADEVDILNVKCDPQLINFLLNEPGFLPAYHLHKGSWITILLDGRCPLEKVCKMLEQSYKIISGKGRKSSRDCHIN